MAITATTSGPSVLLEAIRKAIDENGIRTWSYDSDGDFTHAVEQWNRRAWLHPSIQSGTLVLNILSPKGTSISTEIYAIYHGRFVEMLLAHFDSRFSSATATALPTVADAVAA